MGFPQGDDLKHWLTTADVFATADTPGGPPPVDGRGADPYSEKLRQIRQSKDEERTILVLNSASPNLLESDFYRLANQGRHVDGWAVGISKGMSFFIPERETS